jgi:hypothetical protein
MEDRMCFKINQKHIVKLRLLLLPTFILILFACATVPTKTYEVTVSQWKSYKDADKWMRSHFSFDIKRAKEAAGKSQATPRSPEETFKLKSGVCFDSAYFLKDVLNRIDPSYDAQVIKVEVSPYPTFYHDFVCSFKKEGKLFIMMQYGSIFRNMVGVHGPFNSLDEFKKYYESIHPRVKEGLKVVQVIYRD